MSENNQQYEVTVPFGKHKGAPINRLEDDTLCYLASIFTKEPYLSEAMAEIDKRGIRDLFDAKVKKRQRKEREDAARDGYFTAADKAHADIADEAAKQRENVQLVARARCPHCGKGLTLAP